MIQLNENNIVEFDRKGNSRDANATEIWCDNREISEIKPNLFDKYKMLTNLQLYSNKLTAIPHGLFHQLSELREIALYNNHLEKIDADIFAGNPKLTEINLKNTRLESLPPGVFDNLPELDRLFLGENGLRAFDFNSLKDSPKLKILQLSANGLFEIHNFGAHKTLWKKIKHIDLSYNLFCSLQEMRDNSDPEIVQLDEEVDIERTRKLCAENEKLKLAEVWMEERKQLMSELEDSNTKIEELEGEKKQLTFELEVQMTKYDEMKRDLLAEREKLSQISRERDEKTDNFQELMIKLMGDRQKEIEELSKKLEKFAICKVDHQKINSAIPKN